MKNIADGNELKKLHAKRLFKTGLKANMDIRPDIFHQKN